MDRPKGFVPSDVRKGAYLVMEPDTKPEVVFVATGSEVSLAVAAAKQLGVSARVVSMPCVELFEKQSDSYREQLIPSALKKVVVEAGITRGWLEVVNGSKGDTLVIGIDHFGASAPAAVLAKEFGFTPEQVVSRVKQRFFS